MKRMFYYLTKKRGLHSVEEMEQTITWDTLSDEEQMLVSALRDPVKKEQIDQIRNGGIHTFRFSSSPLTIRLK